MFSSVKSARRTIAAALLAGLLTMGYSSVRASFDAKNHGPIPWMESLDKAKAVAKKDNKVILVDFWAEWCGPCKKMLATTYKDKAVVERAKKFVPVLINVDKQPAVGQKYEVESIPTALFLDAKGKVLVRSVGLQEPDEFLKLMDEALKKAK